MIAVKKLEETPRPTEAEIAKQIEKAAYYCYLDRTQYAQEGSELCDWVEAENKVRDKLTKGQEKLFDENLLSCPETSK
jgi:hypothetical protein